MSTLYIVIGNVGAGKTTALPLIGQALNAEVINADELFQVSPFRDRFLQDKKRWALANELWLTEERRKLTQIALEMRHSSNVLIDGGLLTSWIYTRSHVLVGDLSEDEWQIYERFFDYATAEMFADIEVIHFTCPESTLLERIQMRGRDYELEFYTTPYLLQLQKGIQELLLKLQLHNIKIHTVESHRTGDLVSSASDKDQFVHGLQAQISPSVQESEGSAL